MNLYYTKLVCWALNKIKRPTLHTTYQALLHLSVNTWLGLAYIVTVAFSSTYFYYELNIGKHSPLRSYLRPLNYAVRMVTKTIVFIDSFLLAFLLLFSTLLVWTQTWLRRWWLWRWGHVRLAPGANNYSLYDSFSYFSFFWYGFFWLWVS